MPSLSALLAEGFALGLAAGSQCLFSCAPLMVPLLLSEPGKFRQSLRSWAEFMLGRLAAYMIFALAVGWLGKTIGNRLPPAAMSLAILVSGLWLLGYAFWRSQSTGGPCEVGGRIGWIRRTPMILGFLVGINICAPFAAGLIRVLTLGNPLLGLGYFLALYAGTSLYLIPFVGLGSLAKRPRLQRIGQLTCLLAGLWFTGLGLYALIRRV
jgi:sulfite exporter TauE/SafE